MNQRPKILIVDDEPFNVDYLEQELDDMGYDTVSAVNGQDALNVLNAEQPDLILLDIMMPIMDGFAVLAHLKADTALRNIPVIVISANNDLQSVVKGIKLGAEDYLPKPFEPVLLHARISSSLEKKKLRDEHRRLIQAFADKDVAEELMSKGYALGGKLTQITSMFTDIRNYTTITEANDPEVIINLINQYYLIVIDTVQSYGGNANQMQGDGLMSYFGAPVFHPDHAQRAVSCALEIRRKLAEFNQQQAEKNALQIEVGIGIATGQVVAGFAGTQTRATYICVGDTVNLSSRLESHTKAVKKPIVIDENTRNGLASSFELEPLGEELFKGKTVPVQVYSVKTV
jgi:class 3 adenylate cyclase